MKLSSQNPSFTKYDYKSKQLQKSFVNQDPVSSGAQPIRDPQMTVSFKGAETLLHKFVEYGDYKKLLQIAAKDIDNVGVDLLDDLIKRGAHGENKFIQKIDVASTVKVDDVIKKVESKITFKEDKFVQSFIDSVTFPIRELPFLVTDFVLNAFSKVPLIKAPAKKLYDSAFLAGRRESSQMKEDVNKVKGLIDKTDKLVRKYLNHNSGVTIDDLVKNNGKNPQEISDGLFKTANKHFDPESGNYNTVHERALNRVVSGLIPAAFLANDAYNLSVLCRDDKQTSLKEKNIRVNQEVSRVLTNAYIQLIALGSLGKFVNNSPLFSAGVSAVTVLIAETFSRLANGRPINFISSEQAKEINKKDALKQEKNNAKNKNNVKTIQLDKPQEVKDTKASPAKLNFGESKSETNKTTVASKESATKNDKEKKTVITFSTFKKAIGVIVGGGIALSYLRNRPAPKKAPKDWTNHVDNAFKVVSKFWKNKIYNKIAKKDFELSVEEFDNVIKNLRAAGQKNLANKYEEIVAQGEKVKVNDKDVIKFRVEPKDITDEAGNVVKGIRKPNDPIMQVDSKYKPYFDVVIEPFKFAWGAVKLPFKIVKSILSIPAGSINVKLNKYNDARKLIKEGVATKEELALANKIKPLTKKEKDILDNTAAFFGEIKQKESKSTQQVFASSIEKVFKKSKDLDSGKITKEKFDDFVNSAVINSFNSTTQSSYSNADLGMITKIASSAVTSGFLVADNYNMVMLKSNGENKEDAKQKAQERVVQRVSSLFYQTLFMKWFNSTFCNTYHSSLAGMSGVVGVNTVATEVFTRTSIGMPLGAKTYEQLVEIDDKNLNRKDFLGSYFRFMSQLTGKKPLAKNPSMKATETPTKTTVDAFALLKKQDKKVATTDLLAIYGSNNK